MEQDYTKTEWNGGDFKNLRIHKIIEGMSECAMTNNIGTWLTLLQRFSKELNGFKKKDEMAQLNAELKRLAETINNELARQKNVRVKNKETPAEIIDSLNEYEDKLWIIFNRSGLETRLSEDANDVLR